MKHIVIDNTAIRVSRIAFGTASLHHLFSSPQRQRLLEAAALAGITHFDTSPFYGYGLAELDLGAFLRGRRTAFTVTTKVGLYPRGAACTWVGGVWARKALGKVFPPASLPVINWQVGRAQASLLQSLRRLDTDYVDFVFLHEPQSGLIQADEFMRWMESERARGSVRSWGLAGEAACVAPWVVAGQPFARIVQTLDSLDRLQADFMFKCGRSLQFTYGYLSSRQRHGEASSPGDIIKMALRRNTTGAVIFSARRPEHVAQIGAVV
jgi:aryl-alcohol dehydrogenase-like predicted oxidoreductase